MNVTFVNMTFFCDLKKLFDSEPHLSVHVWKSENSDYCDQLDGCKNLYLCFNSLLSEDCMYSYDSRWSKDCCDVSYSNKCELCYEGVDLERCYGCNFCQDCTSCTDCRFSYDLRNCEHCFGCAGLRYKKYYFFNEDVGQEKYEKMVKEWEKKMASGGGKVLSEIYKKLEELELKAPRIALWSTNSENSFGNYVVNCKNSYYVHKVHNLEDSFYMFDCQDDKDCADGCAFNRSELCYGCIENSMLYNCNFTYWCATLVDCEYMLYCFDCSHCFGCMDLKNKKFCILNKQYTEKEYYKKLKEIKEGMKMDGEYGGDLATIFDV